MKKLGIYAGILLIILVSLSLWLGSSAKQQIRTILEQSQGQLPIHQQLQHGDISVSAFAGNIHIQNLQLRDDSLEAIYATGNLELDMSYIDFLRIYMRGMERGLKEMSSLHLHLDEPHIQIDSTAYTASALDIYHRGEIRQTLQMLQDVRPAQNVIIQAELQQFEWGNMAPIQEVSLDATYDPALQHFAIRNIQIQDPQWEGQAMASIRLKAATNTFSDWEEVEFNYQISKKAAVNEQLLHTKNIGQILGESISLRGNAVVTNTSPTQMRKRFPVYMDGRHTLTGSQLTWKPSPSLIQEIPPLNMLSTAQPNGIRVDELKLVIDRNPRTDRLVIEEFKAITPMMTLAGQGNLQLYPGDIMTARFVESELRAYNFSAGMRQLIHSMSSYFNIPNPDRSQFNLRLTGPLGAPKVLPTGS
ncbi:MAG: hypothetical protein ACQETE_15600 [Bacteroidota bacterium]